MATYHEYETITSAPLKLPYFLQIHGKRIPLCATVSKSVFGIGKNDVLACGQLMYMYCLKETSILNIMDIVSGRKLAVPLNAMAYCSVIYSKAIGSQAQDISHFQSPTKLKAANPLPKVVAVEESDYRTGSSSVLTFDPGEVLAVKEINDNGEIVCYSISNKCEKVVAESCSKLSFTTDPLQVKVKLRDVANHVELPINASLYFDDSRMQQSFGSAIVVNSVGTMQSVLASLTPPSEGYANVLENLVEVFSLAPISLAVLESVHPDTHQLMMEYSRSIVNEYSPFVSQEIMLYVSATATALQERLFSSDLTTKDTWKIGVKLYVPLLDSSSSSAGGTAKNRSTTSPFSTPGEKPSKPLAPDSPHKKRSLTLPSRKKMKATAPLVSSSDDMLETTLTTQLQHSSVQNLTSLTFDSKTNAAPPDIPPKLAKTTPMLVHGLETTTTAQISTALSVESKHSSTTAGPDILPKPTKTPTLMKETAQAKNTTTTVESKHNSTTAAGPDILPKPTKALTVPHYNLATTTDSLSDELKDTASQLAKNTQMKNVAFNGQHVFASSVDSKSATNSDIYIPELAPKPTNATPSSYVDSFTQMTSNARHSTDLVVHADTEINPKKTGPKPPAKPTKATTPNNNIACSVSLDVQLNIETIAQACKNTQQIEDGMPSTQHSPSIGSRPINAIERPDIPPAKAIPSPGSMLELKEKTKAGIQKHSQMNEKITASDNTAASKSSSTMPEIPANKVATSTPCNDGFSIELKETMQTKQSQKTSNAQQNLVDVLLLDRKHGKPEISPKPKTMKIVSKTASSKDDDIYQIFSSAYEMPHNVSHEQIKNHSNNNASSSTTKSSSTQNTAVLPDIESSSNNSTQNTASAAVLPDVKPSALQQNATAFSQQQLPLKPIFTSQNASSTSDIDMRLQELTSKLEELSNEVRQLKMEVSELKGAGSSCVTSHTGLKDSSSSTSLKHKAAGWLNQVTEHEVHTGLSQPDIASYSIEEVQALLDAHDLGQYKQKFKNELVDGSLLLMLDEESMKKKLEIQSRLHRLRLKHLIKSFQ